MADSDQETGAARRPLPVLAYEEMDFERFNASLEPCHGIISPLAPDTTSWSIASCQRGDLVLQVMCEGGANSYEAEVPDDLVSVVAALPAPAMIRYNGVDLAPGSLAVLRPGDEVTSYNPAVTRYGSLSMPVNRLESLLEHIDPARTEQLLRGSPHLEIEMACWHRIVDLLGAVTRSNWPATAASQRALLDDLTDAFVGATASSLTCPKTMVLGRGGTTWRNVISRVREFINAPSHHTYSVAELARYACVSERTLRDAVSTVFGVSPKQLIMLRQMRDIHMALLHPHIGDTVSSIAARHGVWEFGRFAGRYQQVYGEKPSETLASARSTAPRITMPVV